MTLYGCTEDGKEVIRFRATDSSPINYDSIKSATCTAKPKKPTVADKPVFGETTNQGSDIVVIVSSSLDNGYQARVTLVQEHGRMLIDKIKVLSEGH